jgi:hypothetical protein
MQRPGQETLACSRIVAGEDRNAQTSFRDTSPGKEATTVAKAKKAAKKKGR